MKQHITYGTEVGETMSEQTKPEQEEIRGTNLAIPEMDLLRCIFVVSASTALTVCESLEEADFINPTAHTIMRTIHDAAIDQIILSGEGDKPVPASVIDSRLRDAGQLEHGRLWVMLSEAITGDPIPHTYIWELVRGLKATRARIAVRNAGQALISASNSSNTDIILAYDALKKLPPLLERAEIRKDQQ